MLLVFGWFLSGGDAPAYTAADEDWTDWAEDNRLRSGVGAFLILLAGMQLSGAGHGEPTARAANAFADKQSSTYPEVAAPELDPSAYAGAQVDGIPLALLPQQIVSLVAARGGVDDDDLIETVLRGNWDSDERVPKLVVAGE